MVLLDIADWRPALANCITALKPGAILIYSLHHPVWVSGQFAEWATRGVVEVRDYLNEHDQTDGHAPNFHRPLSLYLNETIRLGCTIIEVAEPGCVPIRSRALNRRSSPGSPTTSSLQHDAAAARSRRVEASRSQRGQTPRRTSHRARRTGGDPSPSTRVLAGSRRGCGR